MSRQDTTILNPTFAVEQTIQAMQLEYIEGYNTKTALQRLTLEGVRIAVEKIFGIEHLAKKTNARPYPDARKIFVLICWKRVSIDEGEIMDYIQRHRTSFYHNKTQGENLIETDKYYKGLYDQILIEIGL